jgi:hypothetical protein
MDPKEGELAVKFAREVMEKWVSGRKKPEPPKLPKVFSEKRGVFTTLHTYPGHELRGCIGLPYPIKPLVDAIMDSAMSVTRDPRFPELGKDELDKIIVEVSILTKPEKIEARNPGDYMKRVEIGKDGLIIKSGFNSGLLLPQVAAENGFDQRQFLECLCWKAALPSDAWKSKETEIYKFQAEIFKEQKPRGKIVSK